MKYPFCIPYHEDFLTVRELEVIHGTNLFLGTFTSVNVHSSDLVTK